jgi:hypothetical protein
MLILLLVLCAAVFVWAAGAPTWRYVRRRMSVRYRRISPND